MTRKTVIATLLVCTAISGFVADAKGNLNDRAYFAHPCVEYSKEGIENLAEAVVVLAPEVPLYVETAAKELAEYLGTACGKKIEIVRETEDSSQNSQGKIYVGSTRFSAENGIDTAAMDSEQWLIRTVDGNLILTGGDPRGTLYAVYHFLEKVVGIRWWSPWEEHIPQRENLASGVLEISGMPAFKFRCLNTYNLWVTPSGKEKVWAPRNRLNNEMHSSIPFEYGGGYENGPPSFVHTEGHYYEQMKRDGTLKVAWCAEKDGERTLSHPLNQLCLSNHEMRAEFLKLLRANIAKSHTGQSPATIFDVSFNDTSTRCECENCNALVKKYGDADSGLMLEFINDMADAIKEEYPDVIISTLAYMNTEVVPEGIVPHDNVMIVLCNTLGNYLRPISSDSHFANVLKKWSKVTKRIKIWDYHSVFEDTCLPMPFESTFQPDLQLFQRYNVFGAMTELHCPVFEDMRDLRFWLLAKLLEDPWQSLNALIMDFTEGFYGPAGKCIRQYLVKLDTAAKANPSRSGTQTTLESCKFITSEFVLECQELFEQAERLVSDSPEFLRRVRHARLGVDKCAYILYPKIKEKTTVDRNSVAERIKKTIDEQFQLRAVDVFPDGEKRMEASRDGFLTIQMSWYVATNGTGNGSSWLQATNSLQDAIDAASVGDTVWVSNGVYGTGGRRDGTYITNRIVINKAITVRTVSSDPAQTVIQGAASSGVLQHADAVRCVKMAANAKLIGFTLMNGATMTNKHVWGVDSQGGGAFCNDSSAMLSNCVIRGNVAYTSGGGVRSGTLYDCAVIQNTAYVGGGCNGSIAIGCLIVSNVCSNIGGGAYGGSLSRCIVQANAGKPPAGKYTSGGGTYHSTVTNCQIIGNSATSGGGCLGGTITRSIVRNNTANTGGGVRSATLYNCLVYNNSSAFQGGGAWECTLYNCTLYENTAPYGGNAYRGILYNCISWGSSKKDDAPTYYNSCGLDYSGNNSFSEDPRFIDPAGGNFRLRGSSPCIDAGVNQTWMATATDLDGQRRILPAGGTVDLGPYEYKPLSTLLFFR